MGLFKKKKVVFVIIEFPKITEVFDYPKHLPIPKVDEIVYLDGKSGTVFQVKHMTDGDVTQIYICTK